MRNKLSELDDLINDVITVSETTLDWEVKHGLIFSESLFQRIADLSRELGILSCDRHQLLPKTYQEDGVLAFVSFLQEVQKIIATVLDALRKKANDAMAGRQGFK